MNANILYSIKEDNRKDRVMEESKGEAGEERNGKNQEQTHSTALRPQLHTTELEVVAAVGEEEKR